VRGPASMVSPIDSSSKVRVNGWTADFGLAAPLIQVPVMPEDVRAALDGGALHVVHDAADAAQFLAAAGASRAAMDHVRQRRAVAGGLLGAVAVVDIDAAMGGAGINQQRAGDGGIMGDDGSDEAALAAVHQLTRVGEIA
jgi:hypothetical protein